MYNSRFALYNILVFMYLTVSSTLLVYELYIGLFATLFWTFLLLSACEVLFHNFSTIYRHSLVLDVEHISFRGSQMSFILLLSSMTHFSTNNLMEKVIPDLIFATADFPKMFLYFEGTFRKRKVTIVAYLLNWNHFIRHVISFLEINSFLIQKSKNKKNSLLREPG